MTAVDNTDFLRISIISVPEKGKANKELIKFLSKELNVAKSNIEIISGESTHFKKIRIKDLSPHVIQKLQEWSMA